MVRNNSAKKTKTIKSTTITENRIDNSGIGEIAFVPVSSVQSNLFNFRELSKQFSKVINEASKNVVALSDPTVSQVEETIQKAFTEVYQKTLDHILTKKAKRNKRSTKDPNAPKKPLSNYMIYCMTFRSDLQAKHQNARPTEISRMLGAQWNLLTPEQKAKYIDPTFSE